MKHQVIAIRDRAADTYGRPMCVPSIGIAIRQFQDEVNNPREGNNDLYNHPEDFDLYFLGLYDDADGSFELTPPRMVAVGKEMKKE